MDIQDIQILAELIENSTNNQIDYSSELGQILSAITDTNNILRYIACIIFFFVIVIVCRFAYKHFNLFFK